MVPWQAWPDQAPPLALRRFCLGSNLTKPVSLCCSRRLPAGSVWAQYLLVLQDYEGRHEDGGGQVQGEEGVIIEDAQGII